MKTTTLAVLATLLSTPAMAMTYFQPDDATASSFFNGSYHPDYTRDGSGMPGGWTSAYDPSATHDPYLLNNHWTTSNGTNPTDAVIDWYFSTDRTVGSIWLWTHQSTVPHAANAQYEPVVFDLTFYDSSSSVLAFWDDYSLAPDTNASQMFSFGSALSGVRRVSFDVEATQGSTTYTGLAEVLFGDEVINNPPAIPVPASLGLMLTAMGGAVVVGRRRRS